MPKILFINNIPDHCGVKQYGLNTYNIIVQSKNMDVEYAECNTWDEAKNQILKHSPYIALYNYHPITMPWFINKNDDKTTHAAHMRRGARFERERRRKEQERLKEDARRNEDIAQMGNIRHVGIIHDPNTPKPSIFNYIVHQSDIPRILFNCEDKYVDSGIPIIGSFGFGAWHKGFHHLVLRVQNEYDNAIIRLHIPNAHYINTNVSKAIAERCEKSITKTGIKLEIDHDFFSQQELVSWLNKNTINVFHYETMEGCGNSSSLDQALSSKRPIGITKSYMFRHMVTNPSIFIEDLSLKEIISNGIGPLLPYYEKWSNENFIKAYEDILLK